MVEKNGEEPLETQSLTRLGGEGVPVGGVETAAVDMTTMKLVGGGGVLAAGERLGLAFNMEAKKRVPGLQLYQPPAVKKAS